MYIDEAAEMAKNFLLQYTKDQYYFTPKEVYDIKKPDSIRLYFFKAESSMEIEAGPTIVLFFVSGSYFYEHDVELRQCVQECMDALKANHPDLFEYRLKAVVRKGNLILDILNYE